MAAGMALGALGGAVGAEVFRLEVFDVRVQQPGARQEKANAGGKERWHLLHGYANRQIRRSP